jgi:anhydro-N-acetylmuramic acid kinase
MHFPTAFAFARSKYVFNSPPKSTDGPEMTALFEESKRIGNFTGSPEDEIATACGCCVYSIKTTLDRQRKTLCRDEPVELLVSGGGVNNPYLMNLLQEAMQNSGIQVLSMDPTLAQAREAMAFALLGAATLDGVPSNVPSVTGAQRPVVLGSITPKP